MNRRLVRIILLSIMTSFVLFFVFSVPVLIASDYMFDWRNWCIALMVPYMLCSVFADKDCYVGYKYVIPITLLCVQVFNFSTVESSVLIWCVLFLMVYISMLVEPKSDV